MKSNFSKFVLPALLLPIGIVGSFYVRASSEPSAPPIIHLDETKHDFGVIEGVTDLTHDFPIKNTGGQNLRIQEVAISCSCVKDAHIAMDVIPPGKTGYLHVVWEPSGGEVNSELIKVKSNDPKNPLQEVVLKAQIKSVFSVSPSVVNFGLLQRSELPQSRSLEVEKQGALPEDARIELKSQTSDFETTVEKVANAKWNLKLTLKPTAPLGPVDGRLTITPSWPGGHPYNVVVLGKVIGNVAAEPDEVYVETSDVGSTFQRTLQIESEKGAITKVTVQPTAELQGIVKVSVQGSSINLNFTLNPVTSPKTLRGFLKCEVTMDDGTKENLLVPVSLVS